CGHSRAPGKAPPRRRHSGSGHPGARDSPRPPSRPDKPYGNSRRDATAGAAPPKPQRADFFPCNLPGVSFLCVLCPCVVRSFGILPMLWAYQQQLDPLYDTVLWSSVWSTILAALPVIVLFWLLVPRRWLAPKAAAAGAVTALLVAVVVYRMP